ncbi:MAG: dihydrodipicolinate synthase family protein [Chloroflexi bacterium]|nr:dihydrodipicolinate synthase family protein [Chloroflexota bacterium]
MTDRFRGIFSIAYTPFDARGDLLWDDFYNVCDWIARSGAHGLVWPVMASEFTVLSFPERVRGIKIAVEAAARRVPVVIGVHDTSKAGAVALTEVAAQAGADAVIAMPPWATKLEDRALIEDYYRAIAEVAQRPVWVQNIGGGLGSALPAEFVVRLCREIEWVQYLKEEKSPQGHSASEVIDMADEAVKGVFTGSPCYWIIPEHARGVSGCLPGSYIPDVDARIWNLLEAGAKAEARRIHTLKLVLENAMRAIPYPQAAKEVLRMRGIISAAAARGPKPVKLDKYDIADLEEALDIVRPFFVE